MGKPKDPGVAGFTGGPRDGRIQGARRGGAYQWQQGGRGEDANPWKGEVGGYGAYQLSEPRTPNDKVSAYKAGAGRYQSNGRVPMPGGSVVSGPSRRSGGSRASAGVSMQGISDEYARLMQQMMEGYATAGQAAADAIPLLAGGPRRRGGSSGRGGATNTMLTSQNKNKGLT